MYEFTLISGEVWTSSHLPVTNDGWRPMFEITTPARCARCGQDSDEMYHYAPSETPWCVACYKRNYGHSNDTIIQRHLPVSLSLPWLPVWMKKCGVRRMSKPMLKSFMATLQTLPPFADYPELADPDTAQLPAPPPDVFPVISTKRFGRVGNQWGRRRMEFRHHNINYTALVPCFVCGGSHTNRTRPISTVNGIGPVHMNCWEWWTQDGAAEAAGIVHDTSCGHWYLPPVVPATDAVCDECEEPLGAVTCPICCPYDPDSPLCYDHKSLATYRKNNATIHTNAAGVDTGLDMMAALADFYILTDLNERAENVAGELYRKRAKAIANELARYTIMVTGGEARHVGCRSGGYDGARSNAQIWSPFNLFVAPGSNGRGERPAAWGAYSRAFQQYGLPLLDACIEFFDTGEWSGAYGGKKWAMAARLVRDYVAGTISPPIFIDSIFGVQHNGGSLFDKSYSLSRATMTFGQLLDTRRFMDSCLVLLGWATPAVREVWREASEQYDDPELALGWRLWTQAVADKSMQTRERRFMAEIQRYRAVPSKYGTLGDFKLKAEDRPAWRGPAWVSPSSMAKAKAAASGTTNDIIYSDHLGKLVINTKKEVEAGSIL